MKYETGLSSSIHLGNLFAISFNSAFERVLLSKIEFRIFGLNQFGKSFSSVIAVSLATSNFFFDFFEMNKIAERIIGSSRASSALILFIVCI